jgi:hypothetical protein
VHYVVGVAVRGLCKHLQDLPGMLLAAETWRLHMATGSGTEGVTYLPHHLQVGPCTHSDM